MVKSESYALKQLRESAQLRTSPQLPRPALNNDSKIQHFKVNAKIGNDKNGHDQQLSFLRRVALVFLGELCPPTAKSSPARDSSMSLLHQVGLYPASLAISGFSRECRVLSSPSNDIHHLHRVSKRLARHVRQSSCANFFAAYEQVQVPEFALSSPLVFSI
ncbi:hypothetical protein AVEN_1379-1 [Araneus ventricosus]|uniref:Uncharacterized protein n=1 Tax=Araneus ventricosus TaxID=182803 RepID=A0A4Y2LY75_ARAVE|nr:hypothetical protein AVEN_1379-1 [Araneus ventricosus]